LKKVGVVGAGVMGAGVTQNLAQAGYEVVLVDISAEILERAKDTIMRNSRFQAFFSKKESDEEPEAVLNRVQCTTDYHLLKDLDVIIENVTEKWETKKQAHRMISEISSPDCLLLANTSCISITRIASLTRKPGSVIGTHFMNPVPLKKAVEVIRGYHTSEDTIARTKDFLETLGKEMILVTDLPGFVSNRISHLFMNEAAFVVQDQVASPADVDDIFKKCYGHKMGPLETADLIGLDTVVQSLDVLYDSYQDSKFRCCPLLRKMVHAGLLGMKSGQGFFVYNQ
jgi:3-hydroxybutyryl-CoA dehydrogenase